MQEGNTNLARATKIGAGPVLPNANAILDLEATNKGLLLPRISLTATTAFAPLTAHVAGMKVYNTATVVSATPSLSVTPGEYYNDGTQWVRLADAASSKNYAWLRTSDNQDASAVGDQNGLAYRTAHTAIGNALTTPDDSSVRVLGTGWSNTLNVNTNTTDYSKTIINGIYSGMVLKNGVTPALGFYDGLHTDIWTDTASTQNFYWLNGLNIYPKHQGSGTVTVGMGTWSQFENAGSGNVTDAYGLRSQVFNTGTGTIASAYGLFIEPSYGNITNKWGVYQAGSNDKNYLAGNTKIGNTPATTNADALLELESTNKGLLLPRISLTATTAFAPLTAHVAGMKVYNTATAVSATPSLSVTPGEYYNNGTQWVRVGNAADAGRNYAFLRTSDNLPAETVGDNTVKAYRSGNTGFKTNNPQTTIQVGEDHANAGGAVQINLVDTDTANQGLKTSVKKTTGFNYGVNGTAWGAGATRNVGLYGYAEGALLNQNYGLFVERGNSYMYDNTKIGSISSTINPDAILELEATNKGLLLPRVALTATSAFAPLTAHVAGMKVYNTATAVSATPSLSVSPGEYYNDGTKWVRVGNAADAGRNYAFLRTSDNLPAETVGDQNVSAYRIGQTSIGNVNTDGNIYYGSNPTPLSTGRAALSVVRNYDAPADYFAGATQMAGQFVTLVTPPAGSTHEDSRSFVARVYTDNSASTFGRLYGASISATHNGTGTLGTAFGNLFTARNNSTGTITNAISTQHDVNNASTGLITNTTGIATNTINGGTITNNNSISVNRSGSGNYTNNYGLRISDSSTGSTTNNYGIYIDNLVGTNQWGVYQAGLNDVNLYRGHTIFSNTESDPDNSLHYPGINSWSNQLASNVKIDATMPAQPVITAGHFSMEINPTTTAITKQFQGVGGYVGTKVGNTQPVDQIKSLISDSRHRGSGPINYIYGTSTLSSNEGNGNAVSVVGTTSTALKAGSGTVTGEVSAYNGSLNLSGTGTVERAQGLLVTTSISTGTVNNLYGVAVLPSAIGTATVTNAYGLYLGNTFGTNQWGVYQEGSDDKNYFAGSTKIGTTPAAAVASAILEVGATDKGILVPRMTTAQRVAIASPAQSLMVYDTDVDLFYYYSTSNAAWTAMNTGSVKAIATTAYTLLPADSGRVIEFSSATAVTLTVPNNLPVGFQVSISQVGAGIVTFTASGGMVINNRWSATATSGQWAKAGLEVRATNSSILSGDVQ